MNAEAKRNILQARVEAHLYRSHVRNAEATRALTDDQGKRTRAGTIAFASLIGGLALLCGECLFKVGEIALSLMR